MLTGLRRSARRFDPRPFDLDAHRHHAKDPGGVSPLPARHRQENPTIVCGPLAVAESADLSGAGPARG